MEIIHIKQPRKRSYTLQLNDEGALVVKTNSSFTFRQVEEIVEKHQSWIEKRLAEFQEVISYRISNIDENTEFELLGSSFKLTFSEGKNKKPKVFFRENYIVIEQFGVSLLSQSELKTILKKFFITTAKDIFIERVYFYANKYGFEYKNISIKNHRSKWGSCSSQKNLNFDWKLIFCPEEVIDYVIIHEICHLKEMNHSKRFWNLVAIECPQHKKFRKWLRNNGGKVKIMF